MRQWGNGAMSLITDCRLAVRRLLKDRAYFATAVVTLGLAIGAITAIFSVVWAVLLEPWSIAQPDRIVICWQASPSRNQSVVEVTYADYLAWSTENRTFTKTAAVGSSTWPAVLETDTGSVRLAATGVSSSFFDLLGVPPALGVEPGPDADVPNAGHVAMLSHRTWVARFGADRAIVGKFVQLDGQPYRVVGVMPQAFDFPQGTDIWLPVVQILRDSSSKWKTDALKDVGVLFVLGRLRDGVTSQVAEEDLVRVDVARVSNRAPSPAPPRVVATALTEYLLGPTRRALWWLFAAGAALIAIACANVSALMLARAARRQRDAVTRLVLGATHWQLARLFVIEAFILTIAGSLVATLVAGWLVASVVALAPADLPRLGNVAIDGRPLAFAGAVSLVAAVASALGPIVHGWTINVAAALRDLAPGVVSGGWHRTRSRLVIVQVAVSVALLIVGGLMTASFVRLRALDWGFDPAGVVTMTVAPRDDRPSPAWTSDLVSAIQALPNVQAAGAVSLRPLRLGAIGQETRVTLEGPSDAARANLNFNLEIATPGYFRALRIGLKRGRVFDDQDAEQSAPVVIVSELAARQLWPGLDPIGRQMSVDDDAIGPDGKPRLRRTVVGVVNDVRYRGLLDVRLDVYEPARQSARQAADLVVRTSGDPLTAIVAIKAQVRQLDARAVVDDVTTMDAIVSRAVAPWRFNAWLFGVLASLAFVLAAGGLLALVTLYATERSHEFAIRIALGARERDIVARVLTVATRHVGIGSALGVAGAALIARWMASLLFGVHAFDPSVYLGVVLGVAAVIAVAA